jgi:hypothetical protein
LLIRFYKGQELSKTNPIGAKKFPFLWLVPHKKILTWDWLLRKGFVGPLRFILCRDKKETQDHILTNCSFTTKLWDIWATNFRKTNLQNENVVAAIEHWRENPFNNDIIDELWDIFPRLLMWNACKERNMLFFKDKRLTLVNYGSLSIGI